MTIHVTRDIIFDIFARSGELMAPAEIETALNRLLPKLARRSGESIAPWGRWTVMKFIRELLADGVIEKQRVDEDGFQMDLFRIVSVRESSICEIDCGAGLGRTEFGNKRGQAPAPQTTADASTAAGESRWQRDALPLSYTRVTD